MVEWLKTVFGRRRWHVVAVVTLASVTAGILASRLKVNPELKSLLPESSEAVRDLEHFRHNYSPDLNPMALLVEGPDPKHNRAAVEGLTTILESRDDVESVEAKRPVDFFRRHRLLYLERGTLRGLLDRLRERIEWEKQRANPLYVAVEDEEPPGIDVDSLENAAGRSLPERAYYRNDEGTRYVIFVEVDFETLEFDRTGNFRRSVRTAFQERADGWPETELSFSGRHFKQRQQRRAFQSHLRTSTLVAALAVLAFLLVYFRNWRLPPLVFAPLVVGTVWAFGWAELAIGELNVLTASLAAILLGLGVDYGIHLVVRYGKERGGRAHWRAVAGMFRKAGSPCLFAAVSTGFAFGVLVLSSLRAFGEFGLIASGGILAVLAAYGLLLPVLLDGSTGEASAGSDGEHEEASGLRASIAEHYAPGPMRLGAGLALAALTIVASLGLGRVEFDDSLRAIVPTDLPAFRVQERIRTIADVRYQPAFVPVDDLDHARRVVDTIERRRRRREAGELVAGVLSLPQLLPAHQSEKLEILGEIGAVLDEVPAEVRDEAEKLAAMRREVDRIVTAGPLRRADLPESIRRRFSGPPGEESKSLVMVFPSRAIHHASTASSYMALLSNLPDGEGGDELQAVAYERILPATIEHVRREAVPILALLVFALLGLAAFAASEVTDWVGTVVPLALGLVVTAGLCGLLGLEFDVLNILAWPIWLGVGLDAAFHLNRHPPPRDLRERGRLEDFLTTASATAASFATTMLGFGALAVSAHPGLASLGRVGIVGLGAMLVVNLLFQLLVPRSRGESDQTE